MCRLLFSTIIRFQNKWTLLMVLLMNHTKRLMNYGSLQFQLLRGYWVNSTELNLSDLWTNHSDCVFDQINHFTEKIWLKITNYSQTRHRYFSHECIKEKKVRSQGYFWKMTRIFVCSLKKLSHDFRRVWINLIIWVNYSYEPILWCFRVLLKLL